MQELRHIEPTGMPGRVSRHCAAGCDKHTLMQDLVASLGTRTRLVRAHNMKRLPTAQLSWLEQYAVRLTIPNPVHLKAYALPSGENLSSALPLLA